MGGGGSFGLSGSQSKSKPKDVTPVEFKGLRPEIASAIQSILASGGGPEFGGPFAASLTDREAAILNALQGGINVPSEGATLSSDLVNRTLRGEFLSPESNPFLARTIAAAQRPLIQAFDEQELLDRALFTRAGQRIQDSSPFSRARGIATRGLLDALGDVSTRIASGNFQAERGRQTEAVGQAQQIDQIRFDRMMQNLQAQALPRLIADLGIERGIAEFQRRIALLRDVLGISGPLASQFGQKSSSFSLSHTASGHGGVGGGGGGGGGGASNLACWCAAVYFGWGTPEWHAARRWVLGRWQGETASRIRALYLRVGEDAAEVLRANGALRERIRPFFAWAARMGEGS